MSSEIIVGGRELDAFLQSLPVKMEKNIIRGALNAGARVIRDEAKSLAPVGPPAAENVKLYGGYQGALKDSVRVSSKIKNGQVLVSVKAGGKGGKSRSADVFYVHMVEFGTRPHFIAARKARSLHFGNTTIKAVIHPGTQARPFMRPAFDNKAGEATNAILEYIRKRLTAQGLNSPEPLLIEGPA